VQKGGIFMHAVSPNLTTHVKRGTPAQQSADDSAVMALMERIQAENDVPDEYAYRLALIRLNEEAST